MSFELDDRIERLRSFGVQVALVERLTAAGSWLDEERVLLLDRTREDWEQVSICDEVLEKDVGEPAKPPTFQPPKRTVAPPVLSGAERAAEVAAVIVHCKACSPRRVQTASP